ELKGTIMSLASMLGLHSSIGEMTLPQYMNALQRGEIKPPAEQEGLAGFMPTPPARPAPPKTDALDAAFNAARKEQKIQDACDRDEMLARIKTKRIGTYRDPQPGELEKQH